MGTSQKIIFPGQAVATIEETEASIGTFEENGIVYSSAIGSGELQGRSFIVESPKLKRNMQKGDVIYAVVADVFDMVALLEFKPAEPNVSTSEDRAFLKIFEVQERSKGFVESFKDFIRIGDVVKAKIIEISPLGVYVTIAPQGFGVLRAFCSTCRAEMDKNLECKNCFHKERRKMA